MNAKEAARFKVARRLLEGVPFGNIRNLGSYLDSLADLSVFNDCFPGKVRPMDVDGVVDCRGEADLNLEHKLGEAPVNTGEEWRFSGRVAKGDSVLIFWSPTSDLSGVTHLWFRGPELDTGKIPASLDDCRRFATDWWNRTAPGVPMSGEPQVRALAV